MINSFNAALAPSITDHFRHPNSTKKDDTKKQLSTFYKVPAEIRELIFRPPCLGWNGQTPNLIKALRPELRLYNEALHIFFKENTFVFHRGNGWSFRDTTPKAVLDIERIKVIVGEGIMNEGLWELGVSKDDETIRTDFIPATLADAFNIREVILEFAYEHRFGGVPYVYLGGVKYHFNYFLAKFHDLKKVTLRLLGPNSLLSGMREDEIFTAIRSGNSKLKTGAKLMSVTAYHVGEDEDRIPEMDLAELECRDEWFWEAEEGGYLLPSRKIEGDGK